MDDQLDPETIVIHAGRGDRGPGAPMNVSPVFTSTFIHGGELGYARDGNPMWSALEETIGALEGGRAISFASGMAAVAAVLETLPSGAKVVIPEDCYLGVRALLDMRSRVDRLVPVVVDITDTHAVIEACSDAALLWIESPTNPMLRIADIAALAAGAQERGALVVTDNTFATPFGQRPLSLGADVVVHSVTKYLSGHSDLLMGAVVAKDETLLEAVALQREHSGAIPGPFEAFLALRGIRTLGVRLERQNSNALELATRLASHRAVSAVHYPGLPEDPGHGLATRQMNGFGAIVSFELGSREEADELCRRIRLIAHTTSLGGVESSLERRAIWAGEERTPESLIRMSVGCENVEDLWSDLSSALEQSRL